MLRADFLAERASLYEDERQRGQRYWRRRPHMAWKKTHQLFFGGHGVKALLFVFFGCGAAAAAAATQRIEVRSVDPTAFLADGDASAAAPGQHDFR